MHESHLSLIEPALAVEKDDQDLLREYAATGTELPFARLVDRHVALVYSAALRQTGNHAMAQDVTQAVFTILAHKAASIRRETVLAGWLFRAVRFAALDARKMEARRQKREQEAAQMQLTDSITDSGDQWEQLAPLLDEALAGLGTKDRNAVLLRFFEKKSFGEIGMTLGGNENSARVRVVRAVEKLRHFFHRRGVAVSAAVLSGALLANAVQAAPPAMAASLAGCADARLVEALRRRLLWRAARAGLVLAVLLFLICGGMLVLRQRRASQAAELGEAARSVRNLMIAIDRTYTLNEPAGFVALIHFRDAQEEQWAPVLAEYVRAQWLFRQQMIRVFNVRRRTFDATFSELCLRQPGSPTYLRADRAATNIMTSMFPVRFIKAAGAWKWDLFDDLPADRRAQRVALLRHKTVVLDNLTGQIRDGQATNVVAILETIRNASP